MRPARRRRTPRTGAHRGRACALALLLAVAPAIAHEDHALRIAPDGRLDGLPAAYAPASLRLGFAPVEGAPHLTSLALHLRGGRIALPMCVLGLINTERPGDLEVNASWDHDESIVPYYLQVKLFDPGYDPKAAANAGFSLLFDLRSARLIEMTVEVVRDHGQRLQSIPVDLRARCSDDELAPVPAAATPAFR